MLGEIKEVSLRTIWKNEAYNFTPWLSDNLETLGNTLGLELEFEEREVSVGPYSADILAKDIGTGQFVVIENQLEKTNHDHLGKCITYSAILNASAVIWIASKFTEEHKKALDWLNDHTSDEISFYGVRLELWQIDNSKPAIRFNIISSPNAIVRQTSRRKELSNVSPAKLIQLEFWQMFRERLELSQKFRSLQTPRPQYWYSVTIGKSGIHLSNTFNTNQNKVGIRVYIRSQNVDEWLPYFQSHKAEIEEFIGSKLKWNPNPDNSDKIIALFKQFALDNRENWDNALNWLEEQTIKFKTVFSRLIKEKKNSFK